jgi:hypothetical protein
MKIRIVDTAAEPNLTGSVNVNDAKAWEVIDMFLNSRGTNAPTQQEKLDNVASELKKYMMKTAKEYLRYTRQAAFEAALVADSSQYD